MIRNYLLIGLLFATLSQTSLMAQNDPAILLSENAEISLLTASPGDELYSVFGHSAIRVYDPDNSTDLVFNYGTFDFNTPNFYLKFIRGQLLYKLSVGRMEHFVPEYILEGRAIFEQVLFLNQEEKQQIYNFLLKNRLPENAYYHYDFFYDNCATRIRDLIDYFIEPEWPEAAEINEASMGYIRTLFDHEFEYQPDLFPDRTFRDMLQPFLVTMPWSAFGIDLALGLPADQVASPWDFMFLPDEMLVAFALATKPDGTSLVGESRVIIPRINDLTPASTITPLWVFWGLCFLAVLSFLSRKISVIFDRAFFTVLGITGIVILLLWFLTDHLSTKGNMNLLWAIPMHLWFIWVAEYQGKNKTHNIYFRIVALLSLLMLIFWRWIPQDFNGAFYPIVLIVFIKSIPYAFSIPWIVRHFKIYSNYFFCEHLQK